MNILKALQDFLLTYNGMVLQKVEATETGITIKQINTDITSEEPTNYAVTPTGNSKISSDILGNKNYSNNYVFYAKENIANEIDRQETHTFLEGFSAWIDKQNDNNNYPVMPIGYTAYEISVSNILLLETDEDFTTGLYQIQINLKVRRET